MNMSDLIDGLMKKCPVQYHSLKRILQSERVKTLEGVQREAEETFQFHTFCFDDLPEEILVSLHRGRKKDKYLHNHNFFEILYVYRGRCLNMMREKDLELSEGDLVLLNPNALHAPFAPREEDLVVNIILKPSVFEDIMLSLIADNKLFSNFFVNYLYHINMTTSFLYFPKDEQYPVKFIIDMLIREYLAHDICYTNVMQSILVQLFATLARSYRKSCQIEVEDREKSQLVVDIISHINRNTATVTLKSLSEQFQYSSSYISKLIFSYTGKNFSEIIHFLRLDRAKKYLENSDLTINEISREVGFSDANYFYKVFKNQFEISPSEYRKQTAKQVLVGNAP